jgi:Ser/Thr protein kinase RdoA (MazF antagonist)
MQALAEKAADCWPLNVKSITLAAHRENAVFKVEADQGVFALRLHRPGYRLTDELNSELLMMAMLEREGIAVPRPLKARDGAFLNLVNDTQVSVLSWLQGRPLGLTGTPLALEDRQGTFFRLGEVLADMHNAFDIWDRPPGFVRPRWDADGLMGDNPTWGRFWENPLLTPSQIQLLLRVRDRLRHVLHGGGFDHGLIHADLVSENILVNGSQPVLIDFDDSGFGFRLQDLATALVKHQEEADYVDLRAALLSGYRKRAEISVDDITLFLLIRHLSYVGWIAPRMIDAATRIRAEGFIAQAVSRSEQFLARD